MLSMQNRIIQVHAEFLVDHLSVFDLLGILWVCLSGSGITIQQPYHQRE